MALNYKFDTVVKSDVMELSKLLHRCYREKNLGGWTTEAGFLNGIRATPDMLEKQLDEDNLTMVKAIDLESGKIVGCVYAKLDRESSTAHTGMLCVDPAIQSKGLGKLLMKQVDDFAVNNNCTQISMEVITIRHELIAWYERLGYKKTGKTTPFSTFGVGDPTQALEFGELVKKL
jgi:ribosomal protein S18 acetylase RimI-like enzyme